MNETHSPSAAPERDVEQGAAATPRVWALTSYRCGENTQILALAQALGLPYEVKRLAYRAHDFLPGLLRRPSLSGIDRGASSPLAPPWPDLLISAGMRNEPVCRWIKQQSPHTRLVHIGRTWAAPEHFDLIVTTPQYRLPARDNILHNITTMQRIDECLLSAAARSWAPRLAHLPGPYLAVMIGGNSGPYTFGPRAARRLAAAVNRLWGKTGGSLLVSTSARTPPAAIDALAAAIDCPLHLYRWRAEDPDNPYLGFLALAQAIVVTSDSIAMLSEACATGKPLHIFDMKQGSGDFRLAALLYRQLMRFGPRRLSRDVSLVHQRLIAAGHAVWLKDQPALPAGGPPLDDMARTVRRIHGLLNSAART